MDSYFSDRGSLAMFPFNYSMATSMAGGTQAVAQNQQSQDSDSDDPTVYRGNNHKLQFHGNERTMNLNPLILTNIQGSPYFKVEQNYKTL